MIKYVQYKLTIEKARGFVCFITTRKILFSGKIRFRLTQPSVFSAVVASKAIWEECCNGFYSILRKLINDNYGGFFGNFVNTFFMYKLLFH